MSFSPTNTLCTQGNKLFITNVHFALENTTQKLTTVRPLIFACLGSIFWDVNLHIPVENLHLNSGTIEG
jgi:hypothetical protein